MDSLVFGFGAAIVALVLLQLLLLTWTNLQEAWLGREQRVLARQIWQEKVVAARAHRVQREHSRQAWNGYRKFEIQRKTQDAEGVCSYYLVPHDRKPLPECLGGQYLTFRFNIPGQTKPVIRCYSLSDVNHAERYRVTVKRVPPPSDSPDAPPGLVSNYMHDHVKAGDIVDVAAPRGQFTLDPTVDRPAVLIGGGIGITPVLSMVHAAIAANSTRELRVFYGTRNRYEHPLKEELERLARENGNVHLVVCYSRPLETDRLGVDYHHQGHVAVEMMQEHLDSSNYEFLICGPPTMMDSLARQLRQWQVPKSDIRTEAFGPATVSKAFGKARAKEETQKQAEEAAIANVRTKVRFDRSQKECNWTASCENLLDFALANGIQIESGCRAGNCGTCLVAVKSGSVEYLTEHGAELEDGTCLACIAAPAEDLVIDA